MTDELDPYQLLADKVREKELNDQIRKEYREANRAKIREQQRKRYSNVHTYTFRCPHELADQISAAAKDLKIPINTVLLMAIQDFIQDHKTTAYCCGKNLMT